MFHKIFFHLAPILFFVGHSFCFAETEKVKKEIEKIVSQADLAEKNLSLYITTLEGDDTAVIFEKNAHKKMIPASITKVATASAVLEAFPPGYKFKTQLLISKKDQSINGVLQGALYLRGGGDPSFVSENMWFLVNTFLRNKIKKIEGDIIFDD